MACNTSFTILGSRLFSMLTLIQQPGQEADNSTCYSAKFKIYGALLPPLHLPPLYAQGEIQFTSL